MTRAEGTLFGHIIAVPVDIPAESLTLLNAREELSEGTSNHISTNPCHTKFIMSIFVDPSLSTIIDPEVYSPPMGGTFFSRVDLPSDEILRSTKPKFSFKGLVASASENLGLKPRTKHHVVPNLHGNSTPKSPSSHPEGRRKRSRAYTVTGTGPGTLADNEAPPLPSFLPIESEVSYEAGEKILFGGGGGGGRNVVHGGAETKKGGGWKSLVKMLSKPQMDRTS